MAWLQIGESSNIVVNQLTLLNQPFTNRQPTISPSIHLSFSPCNPPEHHQFTYQSTISPCQSPWHHPLTLLNSSLTPSTNAPIHPLPPRHQPRRAGRRLGAAPLLRAVRVRAPSAAGRRRRRRRGHRGPGSDGGWKLMLVVKDDWSSRSQWL